MQHIYQLLSEALNAVEPFGIVRHKFFRKVDSLLTKQDDSFLQELN
jgi:hypothetical protein